jgi:nucleoside-diphosphate-sugar epimerase
MTTDFLVTGGAGFIGSAIVRRLVSDGRSVRVLDNLSTGRVENLDGVRDAVEFVEGDISRMDDARGAVDGVRCVLHLAALPSVIQSVEDPVTTDRVNTLGTLTLLTAARDAGADRFVFSSSCAVYGDNPVLPKREDMLPEPLSPYAVQKMTGEYYCRVFHALYGLNTFVLRYFNVYGPRQDPTAFYSAVIPIFISKALRGVPPTIFGDGEQTRDFVFVDDVVAANLRCCAAPEQAAGGVYNVASERRLSVNAIAAAVVRQVGSGVNPVHAPARGGEVRDSVGDAARAREALGWRAETAFEDGLARTVSFFMS